MLLLIFIDQISKIPIDVLNEGPVVIRERLDYIQKTSLTKAKGSLYALKEKKERRKENLKDTMVEQKECSHLIFDGRPDH